MAGLTKGQETRERIVRETAPLLNKQGFLSTPLADILKCVGLEKGGFYHHFACKEDLVVEAFEHVAAQAAERLHKAIEGESTATGKLKAMIEAYRVFKINQLLEGGGCPILNAAVESDDGNVRLRDAARLAMDRWRGVVNRILSGGIASGEFRAELDPDKESCWVIAAIEGGVMLSNLYKDPVFLNRSLDQLVSHIDALKASVA
jgi:TetR/AcrR family transcriptional regulator, transcriptional repressor for nem operon